MPHDSPLSLVDVMHVPSQNQTKRVLSLFSSYKSVLSRFSSHAARNCCSARCRAPHSCVLDLNVFFLPPEAMSTSFLPRALHPRSCRTHLINLPFTPQAPCIGLIQTNILVKTPNRPFWTMSAVHSVTATCTPAGTTILGSTPPTTYVVPSPSLT